MKHLIKTFAVATLLAAPTPLLANPFCDALGNVDELPKKYAKRGPFHVDAQTGWIFGNDQLKGDFTVTGEAAALWAEIAAAFAAKGVTLTALVAPPRPLFAPSLPQSAQYNVQTAQANFAQYIAALNEAGIAAPDLSVRAATANAEDYYFARDTHWTPKGAAVSAAMLAEKLTGQDVDETVKDIEFSDTYSEKGSLSTVVEKTCSVRPKAETVIAPVYTQKGGASALLGDTADQAIALVGTSFSNRYQRDTYQVVGALSHAMKSSVDNFSVTGGGLVGAMEAFILSGALDSGRYQTVVWEAPYTAPLTNVSGLRQILGALHQGGGETVAYKGALSSNWTQVDAGFSTANVQSIRIQTPSVSMGKLELEFYDTQGRKTRVELTKSDRINVEERSETWTMSLADFPITNISRFKLKMKEGVKVATLKFIK